MLNIRIEGGKQLGEALLKLPEKIAKRILRAALRRGANVIARAARQGAPKKSGNLEKSIRVSGKLSGGVAYAYVKCGGKKAWYWRFVEFGTGKHMIAAKNAAALLVAGHVVKQVQHPGAKEKPFFRPALQKAGEEAMREVAEYIRQELAKGVS